MTLSALVISGCGGGSTPSRGSTESAKQTSHPQQSGPSTRTSTPAPAPAAKKTKSTVKLPKHSRNIEARFLCAGLRLKTSETSAFEKLNLKLLAQQATRNDLLDTATLSALERIDPPPVASDEWLGLLNAARQLEKEQKQLIKQANASNFIAVRKLGQKKAAQRVKLGKIAEAAHLKLCRGFI
ncbi:MAG TPA: hypothetical protein VH061_10275 [Solirubrobacteraceae bacterium]|jgi:hypothetical protein|nr:hypothetical protein [Solirubrobacteraceae bacterium]